MGEELVKNEKCLEFCDKRAGVVLNLVAFQKAAFVPRVGDVVYLPGERGAKSAASYRVSELLFIYSQDDESDMSGDFGPAKLSKVTIYVERMK